MNDTELRKAYQIVNALWKSAKANDKKALYLLSLYEILRHSGEPYSDSKWDTITDKATLMADIFPPKWQTVTKETVRVLEDEEIKERK